MKLQAWPATLLKKETLAQVCFPVNFVKIFKTPFLQNTSDNHFYDMAWVKIKMFQRKRSTAFF